MKHWINELLSSVGIALGIDITLTKDLLGIILVILNILVLVVSIIMKLITWWKKAKKDGKITKEEINEAVEIVNGSIDEIKRDSKSQIDKED